MIPPAGDEAQDALTALELAEKLRARLATVASPERNVDTMRRERRLELGW